MTPTLLGRWQIRLFLLGTVGLVISLVVGLIVKDFVTPLFALLYVFLFGVLWDLLYQFITTFRWDRDWPTSFQVAAGVVEGALVWVLLLTGKMPGVPNAPPFIVFLIQYGLIWLSIFVLTQGPLRIFFLDWRYQGGQWFLSRKPQPETYSYQQQPVAAPQFVGANYPQQPLVAPQYVGANYVQQPVPPPPQVVRSSNPDHRHSPVDLAGLKPVQQYVCACGFASDRSSGNFCPNCGKPKVQQGIS
jgi:hypothetical protein